MGHSVRTLRFSAPLFLVVLLCGKCDVAMAADDTFSINVMRFVSNGTPKWYGLEYARFDSKGQISEVQRKANYAIELKDMPAGAVGQWFTERQNMAMLRAD